MKRLTTFVACLVVSGSALYAADFQDKLVESGQLVIVGSPYGSSNFIDAEGNHAGWDHDLGAKLAVDLGLEADQQIVDWSGVLPGLIGGRYDMALSGIVKTEKRVDSNEFILTANYAADGVGLLTQADNDDIPEWESVCGKRVGFVSGALEKSIAESHLPDGCFTKATNYPGPQEALLDLRNNRLDAFVSGFITVSWLAKDKPSLKVLKQVMAPFPIVAAVSKSNPELAEKVSELITGYTTDGTLQEIFDTYGIVVDLDTLPDLPALP